MCRVCITRLNWKKVIVPDSTTGISYANAARLAGYGYLVIIVLAIFAEFFVRSGLVVPDDAAATTRNIMANTGMFRVGVSSYMIAAIFDVLVAWALYIYLAPVNKGLALLAAWLRLIHAIIFALALGNLFNVLQLINGADGQAISGISGTAMPSQVMLFLNAFDYEWLIGLVFFGLHCFLLGYLIIKSTYIPRLIGLVLVVAALGYLIDSFAHFLMNNYREYEDVFLMIVALPAIVAELSLCLWLLVKGTKVKVSSQ